MERITATEAWLGLARVLNRADAAESPHGGSQGP
jgi:hypothetical protein